MLKIINLTQDLKLIKILPNFLTILNGFCGILAIVAISLNFLTQLQILYLVLIGAVLDFLDGYIANILNVRSKIGAQLDSFSDLITFSIVPSVFVFHFLQNKIVELEFIPFLTLIIIPFSMFRLARFNTLPSRSYFQGLPTPANGIFFMGIPFISFEISSQLLILIIILSCFLLVSNFKLESFKKTSENPGKNIFYVILIIFSVSTVLTLFIFDYSILNMISFSVVIYIFSSLIFNLYKLII